MEAVGPGGTTTAPPVVAAGGGGGGRVASGSTIGAGATARRKVPGVGVRMDSGSTIRGSGGAGTTASGYKVGAGGSSSGAASTRPASPSALPKRKILGSSSVASGKK